MSPNLLLLADSYKLTHWKQYPPGTERVYSYLESRGGQFPQVVFFGLQYLLKQYLAGPVVTLAKIDEAEKITAQHLGSAALFNRAGWEHILRAHGGRLPVRICAVPEGSVVPALNVLVTVENTDSACYWLTNYLETLLVQAWYPITVATLSYHMRRIILEFLERTGDPSLISFKLHDFGFRGVSSVESAGLGGAAHLLNFQGTDTIAALPLLRDHYGAEMAGHSIPAAEHSTITAWGRQHEREAYANMLDQFPQGMVAVVSDSYDVFNACSEIWGRELKDRVLARSGTLVIRPDSGDPPQIVSKVIHILGDRFGFTVNDKGFRVLDPHVRLIQGDGVNYESTREILVRLEQEGWSADNVAFGMGGALLQKLNRDTQMFAFKAASVTVNGVEQPVFKQPVTDPRKVSKAGRLKLVIEGGAYRTVSESAPGDDALVEVFRNGEIIREWTLNECRARAAASS